MKKNFYSLILLILSLPPLLANTHRIGTYNIRVISGKDTGGKAWENRKEYVARIISEKGFDVIGLQEMKDAQQKDLKTLLPGYGLEFWGRDSNILGTVGEGVGIAYKSDRYALLDKGHFFLSENPAESSVAWDASYRRVSVWAKLQDKTSNEIFYYCSTHLDNNGTIARREGARINVETMLRISGAYPCFIVGDMNSAPGETAVHYTFGACFGDSRLLSATPPVGQEGTYSNWALSFGSQRIDYIYCRKSDVRSYALINEDFGRGITPSDHFPVQITVDLQNTGIPSCIYVSTDGDDTNDGSINRPLRTLQKAISVTHPCDTICVTQGTFYAGSAGEETLSLSHSLTFIGGYNEEFTRITGKTVFSGDYNKNGIDRDNARHLITCNPPSLLHIENFILKDAYSDENSAIGGGAVQALGFGIEAIRTEFIDNRTGSNGGAILATGKVVLDNCRFSGNRAGSSGGAVSIENSCWPYTVRHTVFNENTAASGSAVHVTGTPDGYFYAASFISNSASRQGTFCFNDINTAASVTFVNNTFANNTCDVADGIMNSITGGSALYICGADSTNISLVNNTLTGNRNSCLKSDGSPGADFHGAAVYHRKGKLFLHNNIIAGNYSTATTGGDLYSIPGAAIPVSQYNIYTSYTSTNLLPGDTDLAASTQTTGLIAISQMLDGTLQNEIFTARLTQTDQTAYVNLCNPVFAGKPVDILPVTRLSETVLKIDLDNDGLLKSTLAYDQTGRPRSDSGNASIGAIEYYTDNGITNFPARSLSLAYSDGQLVITHPDDKTIRAECELYDSAGRLVWIKQFSGKRLRIDRTVGTGCYTALVRTTNRYGTLRFLKR